MVSINCSGNSKSQASWSSYLVKFCLLFVGRLYTIAICNLIPLVLMNKIFLRFLDFTQENHTVDVQGTLLIPNTRLDLLMSKMMRMTIESKHCNQRLDLCILTQV